MEKEVAKWEKKGVKILQEDHGRCMRARIFF
jgi:hypothetical protein